MTRGERVVAFIERFCKVPEGTLLGKPVILLPFQRKFILDVYDNPAGTSRAYLSMARKNGKTATIAMMLLAHIVGPEAKQNSRIVSGARTRKQAAEVYNYASKMVLVSDELRKIVKLVPSQKMITGLPMNVEYQAVSADAKGAHGGSPILAILDEVGQVRGPTDAFIEAIETSQGAYDGAAMLVAISTQAATDGDLFSVWLDDAAKSKDPRIVCHLYTADEDCALDDVDAWAAANPALGVFRSKSDVEDFSARAIRSPTSENSFRWLFLNQRIEANAPFVSKGVWTACRGDVDIPDGAAIYGGIDLSAVNDLTAKVYISQIGGKYHVSPTFWLPEAGLRERASGSDRVPYDVWERQGDLKTTPGNTIDYDFVAATIFDDCERYDIRKIAFDRWNFRHFRKSLLNAGFSEDQIDGDDAIFQEFGQGYKSMSPALRDLEADLLDGRIVHDGNPVMNMCAANAIVQEDPAGNRKLIKPHPANRIDGMVALAMARAMAATDDGDGPSVYADRGVLVL